MVISADFEKQKQYFVKKLSLCWNIALLQYRFTKNYLSDEGLKVKHSYKMT